jgi:hypothetical protein
MRLQNPKDLISEQFGWQMYQTRDRVVSSTKESSEMTVSPIPGYFGIELTDEASWFDHPRDLLHLVNVKRSEMPQPIIGIGHSMGGLQM